MDRSKLLQFILFLWSVSLFTQEITGRIESYDTNTTYFTPQPAWGEQCRMIPIQHIHLGSLNNKHVYYFVQDHTNAVAEESCSSIHGDERPQSCIMGLIKLMDAGAGNVCVLTNEDSATKRTNTTISSHDDEAEYRSTIQRLSDLWDQECRHDVSSLFGSISRFQLQRLWLIIDGFVRQMMVLERGQTSSTVYVENDSNTAWLHRLLGMIGVEKAAYDYHYPGEKLPSAMIVVLSNPCLTSHPQSSHQTLHACPALQQQIASTLQYVQQRIQQQPTLPILLIILNYHGQFHQPLWAPLLQHFPWHIPFIPHVGVYQPIQIFRRLGSGAGPGLGMVNITMDEPRLFLEHNQNMFISHFYPHTFGTCNLGLQEAERVEESAGERRDERVGERVGESAGERGGERVGGTEDNKGRVRLSVVDNSTKTCFFPPSMHAKKKTKKSRSKQSTKSMKSLQSLSALSGLYSEDDLSTVMASLQFKHIIRHPDTAPDPDIDSLDDNSDGAGNASGSAGASGGSDMDDASRDGQEQLPSSSPFPTNPHPSPTSIPPTTTPSTTTQTTDRPVQRSCLIISVSYGIHFPHWAQQAFLGDHVTHLLHPTTHPLTPSYTLRHTLQHTSHIYT